jgi:hypothetical protein
MRAIVLYDTESDTWFEQDTTAEVATYPPPRSNFCAVAMSAIDGSSHNIYVYGGQNGDDNEALDDMWILTLPAFHWIPVNVESVPRFGLACASLADRYLLTYGGHQMNYVRPTPNRYEWACDQEQQGLRLFDLTNLVWTSRYESPTNASTMANAYAVPSQIYSMIGGNANGAATVTAPSAGFGTNTALASIFAKATNPSVSPGASIPLPASATHLASGSKSSDTAAIAGGVVGALLGLTAVAIGIWLLFRRRRARSSSGETQSDLGLMPNKDPHEIEDLQRYEVDGRAADERRDAYLQSYELEASSR